MRNLGLLLLQRFPFKLTVVKQVLPEHSVRV